MASDNTRLTDDALAELARLAGEAATAQAGRSLWDGPSAEADALITATDPATVAALVAEVQRLRAALFGVLDGSGAWYEIQENTGLPEDQCREIAAMYNEIVAEWRAHRALGGAAALLPDDE